MFRDSVVVVVVRTRPRAIPLAMITMRKSTHGFPFCFPYMGCLWGSAMMSIFGEFSYILTLLNILNLLIKDLVNMPIDFYNYSRSHL